MDNNVVSTNVINNYSSNLRQLTENEIWQLTFSSEDDAYRFYNDYAHAMGFSIRKDTVHKDKDTDEVLNRQYVCYREGARYDKHVEMPNRQREHRALTRCNCKARLRIKLNRLTMVYVVTTFVEQHNHELVPAYGVSHLRSHRNVDDGRRKEAHAMMRSGIKTNRVMDFFHLVSGGYQHVGFLRRDLYNQMNRDRSEEVADGDAKVALVYLHRKLESDRRFFFHYTVNDKGQLEKLFWTDGRSRDEYAVFGDVLVFDATYKTNAYRFPLVILAGANNHRQTCIFGAALIENETTDSYIWVLSTFLTAMEGKTPTSVVTDGDKSMQAAISLVFPNANHRLCRWHLQKNASSNVRIKKFNNIFNYYMALRCSVDEFENLWRDMVVRHGLQNHKWINDVYEKRHMWAEAYLRGYFFAGVKSTQRCEGMNAFLNSYLGTDRKLIDFVRDYHRGLERVRINVIDEEVKTNYTLPVLTTQLLDIERQACNIYTRAVFMKIKKHIEMQSTLWHERVISHNTDSRTYVIADYNHEGLPCHVLFNGVTLHINCECRRVESSGMPCKHIIYVLKCEGVNEIPQTCINPRWTADISKEFRDKNLLFATTEEIEMARHAFVLSKCNDLCLYASKTSQGYKEVTEGIAHLTARARELWILEAQGDDPVPVQPVNIDVLDPNKAKPKGSRPKNQDTNRAPRRCRRCRIIGHQANNCPKVRRDNGSDDGQSPRHNFHDISSQSNVPNFDERRHGRGIATSLLEFGDPNNSVGQQIFGDQYDYGAVISLLCSNKSES